MYSMYDITRFQRNIAILWTASLGQKAPLANETLMFEINYMQNLVFFFFFFWCLYVFIVYFFFFSSSSFFIPVSFSTEKMYRNYPKYSDTLNVRTRYFFLKRHLFYVPYISGHVPNRVFLLSINVRTQKNRSLISHKTFIFHYRIILANCSVYLCFR